MASIDEKKQDLFELIRTGEAAFFAGSGLSIYAGYSSVSTLINKIKKRVSLENRKFLNKDNLQEIAEEFLCLKGREEGRAELIQLIKEEYSGSPKMDYLHNMLSDIPQIQTIITTNYDPLFESTYQDTIQVFIDSHDLPFFKKEKVHLYKIHGSPEKPQSLVISRSDFIECLNQDLRGDVYWNEIRAICTKHALVFIGYSLDDINIVNIFRDLKIQLDGFQRPMYLVSPDWPAHRVKDLKETLHIHYINLKAEVFIPELIEYLAKSLMEDLDKGRITKEQFQKIAKKRGYASKISIDSDGNTDVRLSPDSTSKGEMIPIKIEIMHEDKEVENQLQELKNGTRTKPLNISSKTGLLDFCLEIFGLGSVPHDDESTYELTVYPQAIKELNVIIARKEGQEFFDNAKMFFFKNEETVTIRIENSCVQALWEVEDPATIRRFSWEIFDPPRLLETLHIYRFFYNWIRDRDEIGLYDKESGTKIISLPAPSLEDPQPCVRKIVEDYEFYNGLKIILDFLSIPYPMIEKPTDRDISDVKTMVNFIEGREIESPITLQIPSKSFESDDQSFLDLVNNRTPLFRFPHSLKKEIFGVTIQLSGEVVIENARIKNRDKVQKQYSAGSKKIIAVLESENNRIYSRSVRKSEEL
jgi:hypothetical protein